jgi:hypothetical protein
MLSRPPRRLPAIQLVRRLTPAMGEPMNHMGSIPPAKAAMPPVILDPVGVYTKD